MTSRATNPAELGRVLYAPSGRCTNPLGCDQPALKGRWFCREHVDELERRAAQLAEDADRRRE